MTFMLYSNILKLHYLCFFIKIDDHPRYNKSFISNKHLAMWDFRLIESNSCIKLIYCICASDVFSEAMNFLQNLAYRVTPFLIKSTANIFFIILLASNMLVQENRLPLYGKEYVQFISVLYSYLQKLYKCHTFLRANRSLTIWFPDI